MDSQQNNGSILDVLKGDKAVKMDVTIDTTSLILLGVIVVVSVAIGSLISVVISKNI